MWDLGVGEVLGITLFNPISFGVYKDWWAQNFHVGLGFDHRVNHTYYLSNKIILEKI